MGYVVCHIEKPKGNDAGTSAHIERKVRDAKLQLTNDPGTPNASGNPRTGFAFPSTAKTSSTGSASSSRSSGRWSGHTSGKRSPNRDKVKAEVFNGVSGGLFQK